MHIIRYRMTPLTPDSSAFPASPTQTLSQGDRNRRLQQVKAKTKKHQLHFHVSLYAAATLGFVLLGQACTNALPVTGRGGGLGTGSIVVAALPGALQLPNKPPHQQQQHQQILAVHMSNSVSHSNTRAVAVATATESGFNDDNYLLHLSLPRHKDVSSNNNNNNDHENEINHFTLHTGNPSSSTTSRVLASESTLQPQLPRAGALLAWPKQDEQHLAFLDLFSRVSGKSHEQVEQDVWEERKLTAAARIELETRLRLKKQQEKQEQDRLRAAEGDSRIELKQVSKLHAGSASALEDKEKDKEHHHKGEAGKKKSKSKDGKKDQHDKNKGKSKQDNKNKEQIKATTRNGNGVDGIGGGVKTTPSIFYVPHQDDDALAMALAIREHIEAGRRVIVHLYSDGINALLRDIVSGAAPCTLQHPPHKMDLTLQDVVTGRTHEFRQSLRTLGVKDEDIFETGWSDIEPLKDYAVFQGKLRDLILGYERKYPGASHKCISGEYDRDSVGRNPTHRACWDVATQLLQEFPQGWPASRQLWDFRFYRTYTYYNPPPRRSAQFIRALPQFLPFKQRALEQYKRWDPSHGELAWGYHSVKALIDAAYNDPHVYLDMLDNDPTNPENLRRKSKGGGGGGGGGGKDSKGMGLKAHGGVKMEVGGVNEDGEESEQGMFPAAWKSNREKNTNKMLLEKQEENETNVLDDGLTSLHRKVPGGTNSNYNDATVPAVVNKDGQSMKEDEEGEARWDEKETDMRLQVLKAFDDATRRLEGKEYRDSSSSID
ncbi:MAG: hypothetical protein J3R72DRAFT_197936 [Linnemannia gamsii]|nr:MAG: hypothetical protein J3R72DRAFT_197936 [Linnemannia gamsii]